MTETAKKEGDAAADQTEAAQAAIPDATPTTERMGDEEKIIDGRPDVNYPALLTKDVPGG